VPETWVALVLYFAATKQKDKAEDVLKEAEAKFARAATGLDLAPCYEALGHLDRAKELYGSALAAKPDDLCLPGQLDGPDRSYDHGHQYACGRRQQRNCQRPAAGAGGCHLE
jgi:tetratricopeptide (TPR) repeat protein